VWFRRRVLARTVTADEWWHAPFERVLAGTMTADEWWHAPFERVH